MAAWTNLKTKTVHSTMSEGIRWIIENVKGIVTKDEHGNSCIDIKIAEKYCKECGMDTYRILSTFKNDQSKNIAVDKKSGMTMKVIEARKIADIKAKGTIATKTEKTSEKVSAKNPAKTSEKVKVNGKKKTEKKSSVKAIPENLENQDLIESILAKTEKAVIPENLENTAINEIPEMSDIMNDESAMNAAMEDMKEEIEI
jgi:hypothetical protein